jgi:DNA repair ATPase RecN
MITSLIVDSLRKIKNSRQVIVVTHNPNIPVNAASEKIFEMNFIGGQIAISAEGTIQEKNIRDAICDVMEGGVDALTHRFEKIINI